MHQDGFTKEDILDLIKELKPDGIEANYLFVTRDGKIIDETKKWNVFAKNNNLFVTVGSDFHRKDNSHPQIGFTNTSFKLEENVTNKIIQKLKL